MVRANVPSSNPTRRSAFTLVEMLVVMTLLSLIVLALMAVFSSTQRAFRASVTQTDVLAGGRATMDMMASDLRGMTPSRLGSSSGYGGSNIVGGTVYSPVNFAVFANGAYQPLMQTLPGSSELRTNTLNYFFILGRENTQWIGTGYVVDATTNGRALYPLYRFYDSTNVANSPLTLYDKFVTEVTSGGWTNNNMSHLLNGVVQLSLHAYDTNGVWINNADANAPYYYQGIPNTYFLSAVYGEPQMMMFSNTIPASVQLQIGVLENRAMQRAQSLSIPNQSPWNSPAQWQYLKGQAGAVHLFRQRVLIPNVDSAAYQ